MELEDPDRRLDAPGNGRATQPLGQRIGTVLRAAGLITEQQLDDALAEHRDSGEKLGTVLVRRGHVTEEQLAEFLSRKYQIPIVTIPDEGVDPELLRLIPAGFARKHQVFPIGRSATSIRLAMADPTNLSALDEAAFSTGLKVVPAIVHSSAIRQAIDRYYGSESATLAEVLGQSSTGEVEFLEEKEERLGQVDVQDLRASADDVPVVRLVNMMILEAIRSGASDIHLEPETTTFRVRTRVDGMLRQVMNPPKRLEAAVVSRIKIMASLDIAERRLPQDGRIKLRYNGRDVDLRVNTLPMAMGEGVAMRILDRDAVRLDLTTIGLDEWSLTAFRTAIQHPYGMIIITGPTGSGKTTTLYAAIEMLKAPNVNILTVEDPVEYNLRGVNQVQVNEGIGLTFSAALRAFLRHDPNVVLVGEIRDLETAQIAARAALTGHLVLTTLHTNDSATAISRLRDQGIPGYVIEPSLRLVMAQRLARKLCPACRSPYEASENDLVPHGYTPRGIGACTFYRPVGCPGCSFTGFKGREAVCEVMPITPTIRELILVNSSTNEIRQSARRDGMRTLREAGLAKVVAGVTSLDEILRVTFD